jgi:hypothetical protein
VFRELDDRYGVEDTHQRKQRQRNGDTLSEIPFDASRGALRHDLEAPFGFSEGRFAMQRGQVFAVTGNSRSHVAQRVAPGPVDAAVPGWPNMREKEAS